MLGVAFSPVGLGSGMAPAEETNLGFVENLENIERRALKEEIEELRQKLTEANKETNRIEQERNEEASIKMVSKCFV